MSMEYNGVNDPGVFGIGLGYSATRDMTRDAPAVKPQTAQDAAGQIAAALRGGPVSPAPAGASGVSDAGLAASDPAAGFLTQLQAWWMQPGGQTGSQWSNWVPLAIVGFILYLIFR